MRVLAAGGRVAGSRTMGGTLLMPTAPSGLRKSVTILWDENTKRKKSWLGCLVAASRISPSPCTASDALANQPCMHMQEVHVCKQTHRCC